MFSEFKNFNYFGIYVDAYTNSNNEIKKNTYQPYKEQYLNIERYMKDIKGKDGIMYKPNGISIDTSNFSTIDIDKPDECIILDKLLNDCNFIIKTNKGYHMYFNKTEQIKRNVKCGIVDINLERLWFVPKYLHQETKQEYGYKIIKNKPLNDMPEYAIGYCNTLISLKKCDEPKKQKKTVSNNEISFDFMRTNEKFNIDTMDVIYDIYFKNGDHFNEYDNWLSMAYIGRHLNNTEEGFKLFDKYSRMIEKYKNKPEIENRTFFYGNHKYNDNFNEINILIHCSKLDLDTYMKKLLHLYKDRYEQEYNMINSKFIYTDENKYIFNEWNSKYKCLCLKSSYGTGKTYAFKKIINDYNPKKILFITYRQSLTHSLIDELRTEHKFVSYLDDDVKLSSNRLIIQLDSLKKLKSNWGYSFLRQEFNITKYDLIVLDETEGLLNHMSYDKLDTFETFNTLKLLLQHSNKILCLDGDMSVRTFDFINNLNISYQIYINKYQPNKKNIEFINSGDYFEEKIDNDLKNGLKIVIVSMTKSKSENFYDIYKDKYNVILHNSIDKNKEILSDVNKNWSKCDLLIYTPTIEAGVDFNVSNYFDKCYGIITNKSTTYRAFMQMLNRVRFYKSDNILIYYDTREMKFETIMYPYTYEEIKQSKFNMDIDNTLNNILIHNEAEKLNTKLYFIPSLINMLVNKGHTYKHTIINTKSQLAGNHDKFISDIYNSKDITKKEYEEYLDLQRHNKTLTREQQYQVNRYIFINNFCLDGYEFSYDFMKDNYYNDNIIKNNRYIKIKDTFINKKDIHKQIYENKHNKVREIINLLGFDVYDLNKKILSSDYKISQLKTLDSMNTKDFKILFDKSNKDITQRHLSELLSSYGFKIKSDKKKEKKDGEWVSISYKQLDEINLVNEYTKRRNEYIKEHGDEFREGLIE